jgi:hypothetical protein
MKGEILLHTRPAHSSLMQSLKRSASSMRHRGVKPQPSSPKRSSVFATLYLQHYCGLDFIESSRMRVKDAIGQNRIERGGMQLDEQDRTGQDRTGQHRAGQDRTA